MFDLDSCVHLEEVEVPVEIDDELDRAGRAVVDRLGQGDRLGAHRGPGLFVEEGRGRLLDDLLVAPLDRAFALAQIDRVAVGVGQHLDLDVARLLDELLDEHAVVGEARLGLAARRAEALARLAVVAGDAHALAAAAGRGLDHHRIADLARDLDRLLRVLDQVHVAGYGVDLGLGRQAFGLDLVAHGGDRPGRRSDEGDAGGLQGLDEAGVLGQEAEARMDGLGAGVLAGLDDLLDHQVALGRRRRADRDRLVGQLDVQRPGVGLGIDRHGPDAHAPRRLDDAARDLAPVGDQDLVEHLAPLPPRTGRGPVEP